MSYTAVDWAMAQGLTPSARKFLLVALAHHVNPHVDTCHPSIARLAEVTALDRKTVIAHLDQLEKAGYIADTGQRHGTTKQVKEYRLSMPNQAQQPPEEQSQKRDGSENGTVPFFPAKSTVFPRKEYQKRDTEQGCEHVSEQDIADKPPVSKAADPCPHQAIIDLYHQTLPTGRQVRIWNDTRKAKLRARWKEDPKRQKLEWWAKFFGYISDSDFLTGRVTSTTGRAPFELDLEWIVSPTNFVKIVEGKYHREVAA